MRKIIPLALAAFAQAANADNVVDLKIYKNTEARRLLMLPRSFATGPDAPISIPFNGISGATFENTWCKQLSYTYWSNSKHPGYKDPSRLNQHQDGLGFKCRKSGSHPSFVSIDTMRNSQFGTTFAVSVGKEVDLIDWKGVRYYYGISLTALSYEMPARHRVAYGAVPIWHRGVSVDLSEFPVTFPMKFKGRVGWEELTLPKDRIRVRSWFVGVKKEF